MRLVVIAPISPCYQLFATTPSSNNNSDKTQNTKANLQDKIVVFLEHTNTGFADGLFPLAISIATFFATALTTQQDIFSTAAYELLCFQPTKARDPFAISVAK